MTSSKKIASFCILLSILLPRFLEAQDPVNIIKNGEFDEGKKYWLFKKVSPAAMTQTYPATSLLSGSNCLEVDVTQGGSLQDLRVYQASKLEEGRFYDISFMAVSSKPCNVQAVFNSASGGAVAWEGPVEAVTETAQVYGPYRFDCWVADGSYLFVLYLGGTDSVKIWIDAVVAEKTDNPDHLRNDEKFEYGTHHFAMTIPYRLCRPDAFDPAQVYPLVLALHGAGERGLDNEFPISAHRLAYAWSDTENQKKWPCYVLVPQCPENERWVDHDWATGPYLVDETPISDELLTVMDLLDSLMQVLPIDTNRIYVTGLSMGGYGTWDLIVRYPHQFAAAIPMSGAGDTTKASVLMHLPVWDFHGEVDSTVPVTGSRDMIAAMVKAGRHAVYTHGMGSDRVVMTDPQIQAAIDAGANLLYTEWPGKNHVMWAESYDYPFLLPWVFSQDKQHPVGVERLAGPAVPAGIRIGPNFPNPFNPVTTLTYSLAAGEDVMLILYTIQGRMVRTLVSGTKAAGIHSVSWDGLDDAGAACPSGIYLSVLRTESGLSATGRMLLLR
ncbi:T9SS type A sorting domain-containing protein [bacterium]|nr:T9SS type A sorting domain-containing protein [bacterium]